jgi:hypothetical protein
VGFDNCIIVFVLDDVASRLAINAFPEQLSALYLE